MEIVERGVCWSFDIKFERRIVLTDDELSEIYQLHEYIFDLDSDPITGLRVMCDVGDGWPSIPDEMKIIKSLIFNYINKKYNQPL